MGCMGRCTGTGNHRYHGSRTDFYCPEKNIQHRDYGVSPPNTESGIFFDKNHKQAIQDKGGTGMNSQYISVVMATYNRSALLQKQLTALESQTLAKHEFEVVVVNDGSNDCTESDLIEWALRLPNLRFWTQKNAGPAVARNKGVDIAKGEIIAFTDDDCIVDPDWLENIRRIFQDNEVEVAEGLTYTNKSERTPLTHQIENLKWNPVIPTCNAAYRKSFFQQLGGFDTSFPSPHNEDTELAWRVLEQTKVRFYPEMRVYHPAVPVDFAKQLKRMKMLTSEFVLFRKNKKAYKKWRTSGPWVTIYREVFLKHQLLNLKFHLGFFRNPVLLMKGLGLTVGWWIYLIFLFPQFLKSSKPSGM